MWNWNSKLHGRPWVRTVSQGMTQLFTRVFGTTTVIPASPRRITGLYARRNNAKTLIASRSNIKTLLASRS